MDIPVPVFFPEAQPGEDLFRERSVLVPAEEFKARFQPSVTADEFAEEFKTRFQPSVAADELFIALVFFQRRRQPAELVLAEEDVFPRFFHFFPERGRGIIEILPEISDHRAAVRLDGALIRLFRADDAPEKRRFSRAVRADQPDALAALHVKGYIFKYCMDAEGL